MARPMRVYFDEEITSGCGDWTVQYQFSSIGPKIMEKIIFSLPIVMTLFCFVSTGGILSRTMQSK